MSEQPKNETIRQWYQRTTRRARKAILYAAIGSALVMAWSWSHASVNTLGRIQTFNGALTVPALAVIWTAALVFMFLRPTREAAFRSQESMDAGIKSLEGRFDSGVKSLEGRLDSGIKDFDKRVDVLTKMFSEALNNKIIPAMDCWNRVGQRIEKVVVDGLFDEMKAAMKEVKETTIRLEAKASEGNVEIKRFVTDTKPAIEALKRIHTRLDKELGDGFVEDLRSAMQSVRELGGIPPVNTKPTAPPSRQPVPVPAPEPSPAPASAVVHPPTPVAVVPVPVPVMVERPVIQSETPTTPLADTSHPVVIEKPKPAAAPVPETSGPKEPDLDRALRVISKKKEKAVAGRTT